MIRFASLKFVALLDYVEAHIVRAARDRAELPARAYLADPDGVVTRVELPPLTGADEHEAAGAILAVLVRERLSSCAVLQLVGQRDGREILSLHALSGEGAELERRCLLVERRRDGRIARLVRVRRPGGAPSDAAAPLH
jgi:ketosteroid isomerase-like protein